MEPFIKIAKDFSKAPGARYREDGSHSGEQFYEDLLSNAFRGALANNQLLTIDLDGTYGFATSFLSEAFSRLSKEFGKEIVLKQLKLVSLEEPYLIDEIKDYICESQTAN